MTKKNKPTKVYKQWTVQSSNLEEFENEINSNLEIGWKILDGSYNIIDNKKGKLYSEVLLWEEEEDENLKLIFNYRDEWKDEVMETTGKKVMDVTRIVYKKNKDDERFSTRWYKYKFGGKYRKEIDNQFLYLPKTDRQVRKRYYELLDEDGKIEKLFEYNKNGIHHGKFITGPVGNLKGKMINGDAEGQNFSYDEPKSRSYSGILSYHKFMQIYEQTDFMGGVNTKWCGLRVEQSCMWTLRGFSIKKLLEKGESGKITFLSFRHSINYDDSRIPDSYFDGQIIHHTEDPKYHSYFIQSGKFIEFSSKTGKKWKEVVIDEGTRDFIKLGTYTKFSFETGKKLEKGIIEDGKIKELKEY